MSEEVKCETCGHIHEARGRECGFSLDDSLEGLVRHWCECHAPPQTADCQCDSVGMCDRHQRIADLTADVQEAPVLFPPYQSGPSWERVTEMVYEAMGEAESNEFMGALVEWIGERDAALRADDRDVVRGEAARERNEALREAAIDYFAALDTFCETDSIAAGLWHHDADAKVRALLAATDAGETRKEE
jgi:hypothetical protein